MILVLLAPRALVLPDSNTITDLKYAGTVAPKPWYCRPHNAGIATPKRGITSLIDKNTGIANLRYTGTVALKTLGLQASECYNGWHCWPQEPWHYGLKEYWYTADLINASTAGLVL